MTWPWPKGTRKETNGDKYSRWDFVPVIVGIMIVLSVAAFASDWSRPTPTVSYVSLSEAAGTMGNTTLAGATTVVTSAAVRADSRIFLTAQDGILNAGLLGVGVKNVGSNFTIVSANVLDARQVAWIIVNP